MMKIAASLLNTALEIEQLAPRVTTSAIYNPQLLGVPNAIVLFTRSHKSSRIADGAFNLHNRFVLWVCLSGSASFWADDTDYTLEQGEALLLFPWQAHARLPMKKGITLQIISFEMSDWDMFTDMKGQIYKLSTDALITLQKIQTAFTTCLHEKVHEAPELSYYLGAMLCEVKRSTPVSSSFSADATDSNSHARVVAEACRCVYRNYAADINIKEFARKHSISESHLRAVFKKHMGVGIGGFIMNTRMALAANLLLRSKLRVAEIAEKCGFNGIYAFSRAFKKHQGISPLAFRGKEH